MRTFVNIIATPKGGTHVTGFEQGLLKAVRQQVSENARRLKFSRKDDRLEKDDVLEGLTAVVTVRLAEPQFEGQTKEVLGTSRCARIVSRVVDTELTALLTSTKRVDKAQAALLLDKIVGAMRTRVAARQHKETQRRKNALETSSLPAKLADCRSDDVDRSELFIVEGDSALGTAKLARTSEFQALLPIRGKILNVQKASVADMLKNAECAAIIQVVGAGFRPHLRPGRRALRQDHPDDGRRRRRRAHPHPAADALLPLHAAAGRGRPGLRRRAAAAPARGHQRRGEEERGRLHVLGRRAAPAAAPSWRSGAAATRTPSSGTRASARWTPTSWRRPRWTRATARCAGSRLATPRPPSASSTC